jgi:Flp pilus assembly protein TadG
VSSFADPRRPGDPAAPFWRRLRDDERGISAIEMALVVGLLVMIVLATLDFGRALAARNAMSHALGRATRVVNLNPATTPEEVAAYLEDDLDGYQTAELDVAVEEVSGTTYMRISVSFPFHSMMPVGRTSDIVLNVSTLAPMVSATQ